MAILVTRVVKLSVDDSHLVIFPVYPLIVSRVEFVPVQTVVLPAINPPTEAGETVMVAIELVASAHVPLEITAL